MYATLFCVSAAQTSVVPRPAIRDSGQSSPPGDKGKVKNWGGLRISQGLFNFQIIQIFIFVKKKRMGTSLDELLNAEFKEAFDEFDKVDIFYYKAARILSLFFSLHLFIFAI